MLRILAVAARLLAGAAVPRTLPVLGQAIPDKPPLDLNDPAIAKEGEELYGQTCRYCHGKEGQGGRSIDEVEPSRHPVWRRGAGTSRPAGARRAPAALPRAGPEGSLPAG